MENRFEDERLYTNIKIEERVKNDFIPDLKNIVDCNYFYLSPFRRKYTAELSLRPAVNFAINEIKKQNNIKTILDVGCGNGWFALEMARNGYEVTGIDISDSNIKIARKTYNRVKKLEDLKLVKYVVDNFLTHDFDKEKFDCVSCIGSLHHMPNPNFVINKIKKLLKPNGLVIDTEPIPENIRHLEAAIISMIRIIFSSLGFWYEELGPFKNQRQINEHVNECKKEYKNWADKTELNWEQSPMNNSTSGKIILKVLRKDFLELNCRDAFCWSQRMIGGIRCGSEKKNKEIATLLTLIDNYLVSNKLVLPIGYYWSGKKIASNI
jgi:2-polyprenyl-3-methyl-5-hydroxy-6-metoxy-1,4-benzoquinol methylase